MHRRASHNKEFPAHMSVMPRLRNSGRGELLNFIFQPSKVSSSNVFFQITALTRWTFVGKVMSLLFNTLSRFVIAFLPRSKCLLISWLQSPSTVILEPEKIKSASASTFSPSVYHEVMGPDAMILALGDHFYCQFITKMFFHIFYPCFFKCMRT